MLDKYIHFLKELGNSKLTIVSEMSKLLARNILYYTTNSITLEDCFNETPALEFEDNDQTEQDLRSYNYIREKLYDILKTDSENK